MASDMANWTMLGQAQVDTLGETPEVRDVAFQSLVDAGIASNNNWRPKKEDAGNYISQCADICAKTPTTADELSYRIVCVDLYLHHSTGPL